MSAEHGQEPFHDPVDLLDELDAIIRAQEVLRHRTIALQARYAALEPHANRYDQIDPARPEYGRLQFGIVNIESAADRLGYAAKDAANGVQWLGKARGSAEKVREYPKPARAVERFEVDRRRSR